MLFVCNSSFPLKVQIGNNSYNGIYRFIELKWFLCVWGWASHFLEKIRNPQSTQVVQLKSQAFFELWVPRLVFVNVCNCFFLVFGACNALGQRQRLSPCGLVSRSLVCAKCYGHNERTDITFMAC